MRKITQLFLLLSLLTAMASEAVEVGFVTYIDAESGGRNRYHVFLSYPDRHQSWIHAYPPLGVTVFSDLHEFFFAPDTHHVEVELFHAPFWKIASHLYRPYLGKEFDADYDGRRPNSTYCSKMVGEILGMYLSPFEDDPRRRGISVEEVYDFVTSDRRFRRKKTLLRKSSRSRFALTSSVSLNCERLLKPTGTD